MDKYGIFITAVELGSITAAATELNYTQSGVSYAIAALEKEVGYTLIKRQKTGVSLTSKGELFYPFILSIANQKRRLEQEIDAMQNIIAGELRLGSHASVTSVWLPSLLQQFQELYPKVTINLFNEDYREVARLLEMGIIDLAFLPEVTITESLRFIPLYNDHVYATLPCNHPLTKKASVTMDEFLSYPLILPDNRDDSVIRKLMSRSEKTPSIRYVLQDDISIVMLVEAGLGVSFLSGLYREICPAKVEFRPFDPPGDRMLGLATTKPVQLTAVSKAFIEFVSSQDLAILSKRT